MNKFSKSLITFIAAYLSILSVDLGVNSHNHLGWRQGRLINHSARAVKVIANCVPGFENQEKIFRDSGSTRFCEEWLPPGADSYSHWKDVDIDFVVLPGAVKKLAPPFGIRSFWKVLDEGYNPLSYCFVVNPTNEIFPCYKILPLL